MRHKRKEAPIEPRLARLVLVLLASLAPLATFAPAIAQASGAKAAFALPSVRLHGSVPTLLSAGERLSIGGSVLHSPAGAHVALERRRAGAWRIVVRVRVRRGAFKLSWRPPAGQRLTLRIALRARGRVVSYSTPIGVRIGPAPRYCPTLPRPASVPSGDGWIVGGLYDSGGPPPGVFDCRPGPYTVAAIDEAGEAAASEHVTGKAYLFVLPAGSYELEVLEGGCFSEEPVTVLAGMATRGNTICDIP